MDVVLTARSRSWMTDPLCGTHWDPNPTHQAIMKKVFARDKHTCQGCRFRSRKYMDVHHLDHNHSNWSLSNLVTACPLCHQVFHPNMASIFEGGFLVWLPEMSQVQLNRLLIACFIVQHLGKEHPFCNAAENFMSFLGQRQAELENQVIDSSRPARYGQALLKIRADLKRAADKKFPDAAKRQPEAVKARTTWLAQQWKRYRETIDPVKMVARATRFEKLRSTDGKDRPVIAFWAKEADEKRSPDAWLEWARGLTYLTPDE